MGLKGKTSKPVADKNINPIDEILTKGEKLPFPENIIPMKATLVDKPPKGNGWVYEIKWDGFRTLAYLNNGSVEIRSRNNNSFTSKFIPISHALKEWQVNAVLDGEIVVLNDKGISDFNALQNWGNNKNYKIVFYVFDLIWYEGISLKNLSYTDRRQVLESIFPTNIEGLSLSKTFHANGEEIAGAACQMGLEGVIAKQAESLYHFDTRSNYWLKLKCQKFQEGIIAGYTKNEDSRSKFSALVLGVNKGKEFIFLGTVGTGFSEKLQSEILKKLEVIKECPFKEIPDLSKPSRFRRRTEQVFVTWCKPEIVCEVNYLERTEDGHLRHSSFKGLRPDKIAKDVILEQTEAVEEVVKPNRKRLS